MATPKHPFGVPPVSLLLEPESHNPAFIEPSSSQYGKRTYSANTSSGLATFCGPALTRINDTTWRP